MPKRPLPAPAGPIPAPKYDPAEVAFTTSGGNGPNPPFSDRLQIVRARGGYVLFGAEIDFDQADADPVNAVAVASTPQELLRRVDAWARAAPPAEPPFLP